MRQGSRDDGVRKSPSPKIVDSPETAMKDHTDPTVCKNAWSKTDLSNLPNSVQNLSPATPKS